MNLPALAPPRRLGKKLTAISVVYLLMALSAIGVTLYVAWQLEGGAAAVNAMGSQRMRSYHIGMLVAEAAGRPAARSELGEQVRRAVERVEDTFAELAQGDPARPMLVPRTHAIAERFASVQSHWKARMRPSVEALLRDPHAQALSAYRNSTERFVQEIDDLVLAMEHEISAKTLLLRMLQYGLIALSAAGTVTLVYLMFLLIVRPVTSLAEGMQRMEAGDFDVRLPVETRDEFGALAAGFNRMADRLSDLYRSLERRVAEKTRTLAAKNEELGTLYEAAALLTQPAPGEALCRSFLDALTARLGARAGAVRLFQPESGRLHLCGHVGLDQDFVERERCLERGQCLCGRVAERRRGGIYPLTRHGPLDPGLPCERQGFRVISVFPIRFRDQQIGIFNLYFAAEREFTAAERQMLHTLGQHLGMAIENQRLVAREKEMAISEERNLLAQELHDSIAQSLAFLNLQAQMLEDSLRNGHIARAREELVRIREGIQVSYDDVRELLVHFRTRVAQADIESAIARTLERFEAQSGIRTTFVQSGAALPLSPETQVQVMHIIQECLSNARKHSGAASVRVEMRRGAAYGFRVSDDGNGFDPQRLPSEMHVGLNIMRERAQRIGAALAVHSRHGAGTEVTLELPAVQEKAA